ncbi:MAG: ABC transporter ATP-binding protein [Prolixibacteraceae bacterium]|jgi:ATP-binding cassette, subfamily B, bacterial MsbA|nr:ABC transporter ATP-binding protein [Prolixibacteraceae bacterium]MBT6999144.1 ABC transporter ATP-binding protein [Prolixibacteraceae bacterium]MBT7394368.1 ABC transporter ATP-binding protein [Prolixibacteraceae bacterium]
MRDFLKLLRRFIPPYRWKLILNIVYNFLSAVFGAFSFLLLIPSLQILFGTQELIFTKPEFQLTISSLTENANYYISFIIQKYSYEKALIFIGLFIVITVFLKVAFYYLANYMIVVIRNGVVRDIRSLIYRKILQLPLGFFSDERKGDIMARMTGDVTEVENSIMNSLDMMIKNPILIIVSVVVMIYMSWSLTLFVLIMFPIAGYIIGKIGESLKKESMKGQNKMGDILSIIDEDLSGLRVVKAFNAEKKAVERFEKENESYFHIMNKLMWRRFLAHPMSEFMGTAVIILVLWYGGQLIINDKSSLDAAAFIGYLVFFYNIINPAKAFSTALYSVEKGLASMERIDKILLSESTICEKKDAIKMESFNHKIVYENVSFAYNSTPVLKNISLEIEKGKTFAFVGQSGGGKTTLVDLLPRFWDVTDGKICIDEIDLRDLKIKDLRNLIGNVNQEPILFNDTFFNNIAFGVENARQEDVEKAAKIANAHDFIMANNLGYETRIGDRGDKLSGGQKQRISIARAVLNNPPILILDEATSALDTESEKLVQEALENLMKNRTSLVIAHRLSTIKNADLICVLHKGKVVEKGTHEELMTLSGRYKKLHKMQMF